MMRPAGAALELSLSKLAAWAAIGFAGFVVFGWVVEAMVKSAVAWAFCRIGTEVGVPAPRRSIHVTQLTPFN